MLLVYTTISGALANPNKPLTITRVSAWLITIALAITLIVVGKRFLIPIFLALFIWYLVNAINDLLRRLPFLIRRAPQWLTLTFSFLFIGLALYVIGDMIADNINDFISTSGNYADRIDAQIAKFYEALRIGREPPTMNDLNITAQIGNNFLTLLNGVTAVAKNFFLILVYVIFLLLEQGIFSEKIKHLGLNTLQSDRLETVLNQINTAMRQYLSVKTFTSIITALLSFIVFWGLGLDYAFFWAFLIFLFNYIPTIGSITATVLPALLALLQFEVLGPFLIIVIGVSAIQVAVGNILEPRLMGNTLNISPLVVVLTLILWSILWGVVGMLLSVPITVAIIIVCAQFPSTKNVAVLLSKNGKVGGMKSYATEDVDAMVSK